MTPEQEARADIDRLLTAAGCHVCDRSSAASRIGGHLRRRHRAVRASNTHDRHLRPPQIGREYPPTSHQPDPSAHHLVSCNATKRN